MVNIYLEDINSFVMGVRKGRKEAEIEFSKKEGTWIGKTISGNMNLDNNYPHYFSIFFILNIFHQAYNYAVLKTVNGKDIFGVDLV
jgi:hypothetical protein